MMIDETGGLCDRSSAGRHSIVAARLTRSVMCLLLVISPAGVLFGDASSATGEAQPSAVQEATELQVGASGSQARRVQPAATVLPVDALEALGEAADAHRRGERALGFGATDRLLQPLRGPPGAVS
jgi:hypothetical protein